MLLTAGTGSVPASDAPSALTAAGGARPLTTAPAGRPGSDPAPSGSSPSDSPWTPPSWDEVVRTHSARVYRLAYR
jgi:RNA polymerase sigma-70 factor (ECF subfamily)